jgi:chemotaxis protein CheD
MSAAAQSVPSPQRFLRPGEFAFGRECLATVLGSCVSITLWHPRLGIGGMCHYLLPARASSGQTHPLGTYADEAMALFVEAMQRHGTRPSEYQAKLFGGANMFPNIPIPDGREVGMKNILAGRELLQAFGIALVGEDVGGNGHRRVLFDPGSGEAWVKQVNDPPAQPGGAGAGGVSQQRRTE